MTKLRQYFLTAFLILVPIWYMPNFTRDNQENFFQYMAMGMVAFFVGNVWIGSFLILNLFLFLYNGIEVGSQQVLNVLFGCLIFMFSRFFFKTNKSDVIYKPTLIVLGLTLVWMVLQLFHLDPLFQPQTNGNQLMPGPIGDPLGFFGIKEANGTFILICMPILATINPIVSLLLLVPIKLCQSSGVYLATFVVIMFYTFYLYRRYFLYVSVSLLLFAGFFIIKDLHTDPATFTSRFPVWHSAISYSLKNPIGYGPDSYRNYNKHKDFLFISDSKYKHAVSTRISDKEEEFKFYSPTHDEAEIRRNVARLKIDGMKKDEIAYWDNPHNLFINVLFQYGILGLLLVFGLLREMYYRFKYAIKDQEIIVITSCIIVYLITGMTNFPLEIARTGYLFPILLGAFYARTDEV